jgi:hypothetical protein
MHWRDWRLLPNSDKRISALLIGKKARCFFAMQNERDWHFAAVHDVPSNVGNQGISGLVMLMLSFVDPDPSRT